jgi:acetylornithine deacetylase/succinyl-diaminopimelate desuccinylase-like protein
MSLAFGQTTLPVADRQLAREIYKQMVEIKSGFATGATTPVAEAVAARLRAAGFPDSDIFVGGAIPKQANLVVRYHGSGVLKPVLLLAHTDVVEALREDWSTDPFEFLERDRRPLSPQRRHPHLWHPGLLHGSRRHPFSRP